MNLCTGLDPNASLLCSSLPIAAAIFMALALAWWEAKRFAKPAYVLFAMLPYTLGGALIIGRLAYVFLPPPSVASSFTAEWYMSHWFDFQNGPLTLWRGGFDAGGMLVGGGLGSWLFLRQWPEYLGVWGDILIVPVLVGIGIGGGIDFSSRVSLLVPIWSLVSAGMVEIVRDRTTVLAYSGTGFCSGALMLFCGLLVAGFVQPDATRLPPGLTLMQIVAILGAIGCAAYLVAVWRNAKFIGNSD
jgi:hypothetical protein